MKNGIQWRKYRQSEIYTRDAEDVALLHAQTEEALGSPMDLPDMMQAPVLETWLAEREGRTVGGFYCEAVVEPVFFGTDPVVSASARRFCPAVIKGMAMRGFRTVRMQIPAWTGAEAQAIAAEVEEVGFRPTDGAYKHYWYDLRPIAKRLREGKS